MGVDLLMALSMAMGCGGSPMAQQVPIYRDHRFSKELDTLGIEGIVPAPAKRVWELLPAVLNDLGLEVNFLEPATQRIGACYQKVRNRLGKSTLSALVDCGDDRGMPNADRFEVGLTVLVTVAPTSASTAKVYTFVLGVGADGSGTASSRLWCFSRGVLEERIRTSLDERAGT